MRQACFSVCNLAKPSLLGLRDRSVLSHCYWTILRAVCNSTSNTVRGNYLSKEYTGYICMVVTVPESQRNIMGNETECNSKIKNFSGTVSPRGTSPALLVFEYPAYLLDILSGSLDRIIEVCHYC